MGFVVGSGGDGYAADPRGVSEAVEGSRLVSLSWRACNVVPASGAEMKSTVS
jgi:hypothetical protein